MDGPVKQLLIARWNRLERWWPAVKFHRVPKRLRVLETLHIGEKRQLLVVAIGGRRLLIGAATNFIATLAELEACENGVAGE